MNVREAIDYGKKTIGGEEAIIDSFYLLSFLLDKNFTWLKTWQDHEISDTQRLNLETLVDRRKEGEPIAYIIGEKDFWTLTLNSNPSTLIPRPETELLVEKALQYLSNKPKAKVLDLGTGTGAIALAIASERKNDTVIASDYVQDAVQLAKQNAVKNKIENVEIIYSDWFSNIDDFDFDLIVSNPPYVEENDPHLSLGDLRFEPKSALTSSDNGLADIKVIIDESRRRIIQGGMLMIEHGFEQGKDIRRMMNEAGYRSIETLSDLSGLDRITKGNTTIESTEDVI